MIHNRHALSIVLNFCYACQKHNVILIMLKHGSYLGHLKESVAGSILIQSNSNKTWTTIQGQEHKSYSLA